MEVERQLDVADSEQGSLLKEETLEASASRPRMRSALLALPLVGGVLCLLSVAPASHLRLFSRNVDEAATRLQGGEINDCGGYDVTALNDFQHGLDKMVEAGWIFSNAWSGQTKYRPPVENIAYAKPADHAYWGWDYPGNGVISLRLHGEGEVTLNVGNAYTEGVVEVTLDNKVIASIPARTLSKEVKAKYSDGSLLTLQEVKPRGIIVINSISFSCPWSQPGSLRADKETQYFSGASWDILDVNCSEYTIIGHEHAPAWGTSTADIDRKWCGDSCLQIQKDCGGFMYPDPGEGGHECKHIAKISKDRREDEERFLQASKDICNLDLSKWAVHVLKEVNPPTTI